MTNKESKFNWKLPVYGAIGFAIGFAIIGAIVWGIGVSEGYEYTNNHATEAIKWGIGSAIFGAILGATWGLMSYGIEKSKKRMKKTVVSEPVATQEATTQQPIYTQPIPNSTPTTTSQKIILKNIKKSY